MVQKVAKTNTGRLCRLTQYVYTLYTGTDPGGITFYFKQLLHSIFQYIIPKILIDPPIPRNGARTTGEVR